MRAHRRHEVRRVLGRMARADVDAAVSALTAFSEAADEAGEAHWTAYVL